MHSSSRWFLTADNKLCCPFFYCSPWLSGSASWRLRCFEERRLQQLQSQGSRKSVDLLHIQLAHEINSFWGNHLAGHHDRKTGRIWNNKVGGDKSRPFFETPVNFLIEKLQMLALLFTVCAKEASPHIALAGKAVRVLAKAVMEAAEIGKVG